MSYAGRLTLVGFALFTFFSAPAMAQTATTPATIAVYSTIYSVGFEWNITGDTNHNANATINYRVQGTTAWTPALAPVRVDYNGANTLAGSIFHLEPETTYKLQVSVTDPDGGSQTRVVTATTRPLPSPPSGRTFHVVPGTGGGDGSASNPFMGIAAAQAVAQAGDTFLLHGGAYGGRVQFSRGGTALAYVAWKAFGDGDAALDGIDVSASYVWLEGLTVRNQAYGLRAAANPDAVVVRSCRFSNNHYGIWMMEGGRNWYIADNTIVGDTPYTTGSLDGEGIDLNVTGGHTVAHNRISNVADGISYPGGNVDIFGNDIYDTSDDGIEADNAGANLRIWGNRIHNAVHNGVSFQPQGGAPWYIMRNQIVGNVEAAFKFRTTDRFVLVHNTIVNWGNAWPGDAMMCCNEDHLLRAFARNNLWISIVGGQIWGLDAGVVDWRTDLDYDGFDWGASLVPFAYAGATYPDVASLTAASGLEPHGVRVAKETCFESFNVPNPPPAPVPAQVMSLLPGCAAVDAGAVLPNVNTGDVVGARPDIGAFEYGVPPPSFGPRIAAPSAPTNITAAAASTSRINVSWTDSVVGESGFAVEQSTAGGAFAGVGTVGPNVTSFAATGLAASTTYSYRVRAFNEAGWSAYSATASATTTGSGVSSPFSGTPAPLPGTIQVENFDNGGAEIAYHDASSGNSGGAYRSTDVDLEATTDTGGGYNAGWVSVGEWLRYTVNVASAGSYTIDVRVSSPGPGGIFHIEANGVDKTGPLTVPATGGWQAWTTVSRAVSLAAGTQVLRLVLDSAPSGGAVGNFNWIRATAAASVGSTPFSGTPAPLPGTIQVENFDNGGAEIAYHDASSGNSGGAYRSTDVDLEVTTDTNGGYNAGWVSVGEWLRYTVNVASAGSYTVEVRVASPGPGGTFHIEANGVDKTGPLTVPATGGWQTWRTVSRAGVALNAGSQVLRLVMDSAPSGAAVGNFNWIRVSGLPGSTPFTGSPAALPGTIQAENFDNGGAELAYHDSSSGNSGGVYRSTDVDLEATTDTNGGYNVGWVSAGEWLQYSVNVGATASYTIEVRVASPGSGGTFHIEVDGLDKTGPLTVPATGSWQTWTSVLRAGVRLNVGTQMLRLVMDSAPSGAAVGNFNWIRVTGG